MTPGQGRAAAAVCLLLGIVGVYISKRPTTDIAAGILGGGAALLCLAPSVLRWWGNRASRSRVRHQQETPWSWYSRPLSGAVAGMWEVGIERRAEDGRVLSPEQPAMRIVPEDDTLEIAMAEEDAKLRCNRFNGNRVGMPR